MSFSATLTYKAVCNGATFEGNVTKTAGKFQSFSETISADSTDQLVACTLDVSQIEFLYIKASGALTLETNDGSSADDTIALVADEPVMWHKSSGVVCPLTTDVTGLYFTEGNSANVLVEMMFLEDPTA